MTEEERRPEDLLRDPPGSVGDRMPPLSADRPEAKAREEDGDPFSERPEPYPTVEPPVLDAAPGRPAIAVPGRADGETDTRS